MFKYLLEKVLVLGIFIRLVVFIFLSPFNNDGHFQVIQYIFKYYQIPSSVELNQAFHPPLYHVIASLLLELFENEKFVQFFSFLLSVGTLLCFYFLIKKTNIISFYKSKVICFTLPSLLPSFIMFSGYISNDVLAFFLGGIIFLQMYFILKNRTLGNQVILGIYLGLGLLTKGTLLFFIPVIFFFLLMVNLKNNLTLKKNLLRLFLIGFTVVTIGSYKYIENIFNYGRPVVHNLDFQLLLADLQRPTYQGIKSFIDINILKLVKYPTVSGYTKHSYPLMLYGTFWYQYIPEANFMGNLTKFKYIGSIIYILSLLATILIIVGFFRVLNFAQYLFKYKNLPNELFNNIIYNVTALLIFLTTFVMIIYIGMKYDVWSCFQSRLLYSSFFSILLFLSQGLEYIKEKFSFMLRYIYLIFICQYLFFTIYISSEVVGIIAYKYNIIPKFFLG